MPNYERIKSELTQDLAKLTPVINILDELRITGKAATIEESEKINDLIITHSSEAIALMLESKTNKRNAKFQKLNINNRKYNPFILTSDKEIEDFNKYLSGLPDGKIFHYDLIIRPKDVHSTALQIHSDGLNTKSFYIDSLYDTNKEERYNLEKALGGKPHNYLAGKLLNSDSGCSIFSIQHLNSMNRLVNETHQNIYLKNGTNSLQDLDPIFLKHIQSLSAAQEYEENQSEEIFIDKKRSKTFRKHLNDFTATISLLNKDSNIQLKQRNYSSLYKTEKYLKEALKTLEEIHKQENHEQKLEEVLYNRTGRNILDNIYQEMELTPKETEKVQGLYNQDQIKLGLYYGIPKSDLESAKCFSSKEMSRLVFNFINSNQISPLNAFNKIRDMSNPYQLYSTTQLELNAEEVKRLQFLSNQKTAEYSFQYLQKWHNESGSNGALAAFETLKIFESYRPQETRAINTVKDLCNTSEDQILEFCIKGHLPMLIKSWVNAGADINKNINGETPIIKAIKTDNPEIIEQVIMAGAKIPKAINKKYFSTEKLCIYFKNAIDQENSKTLRNIIKFSPSILEINIEGVSPLEYAVKQNKLKLLKELFPQGNNISYINSKTEKENISMKESNIIPLQRIKTLRPKINF